MKIFESKINQKFVYFLNSCNIFNKKQLNANVFQNFSESHNIKINFLKGQCSIKLKGTNHQFQSNNVYLW